MNHPQFEKLLEQRIEKTRTVLNKKSKEYSVSDDKLHNFHVAAQMDGITPQKALWGMMLKHLVSVKDLVDGDIKATTPVVEEKIGDLINYLILLEAVFKE